MTAGIPGLEQNIFICVTFAALGGILEVFATVCLAYPAARIAQGYEWSDAKLKACLAANIFFQILASLSGNLFAPWYGPVSIVGPIFFAAQLLANLVMFWRVLGIEAFSREMQIGTYIIVVSVVLLLDSGPTTQEYSQSFEEMIRDPVAAVWSALLVVGMALSGIFVVKARLGGLQQFQEKDARFKFGVLLVARATAFSLNLTSSKAFLIETTPAGYAVSVVVKIVSGAIYTVAIIVQSTAVEQRSFVPLNAAGTIVFNAVTGMLLWEDWKVVQSWPGYSCVFLLLGLGCTLLLGDLSLLQESAPETFRGAQYAMARSGNRQRLLANIRNIGNNSENHDEEVGLVREPESTNRHAAWAAIYKSARAVPRQSLSTRSTRKSFQRNFDHAEFSKSWPRSKTMGAPEAPIPRDTPIPSNPSTTITPMPTSPPEGFKYTRDVCALSWWRPFKMLEEGSISDIHLVKRRKEFLPVKYVEKRKVMDLAKRKAFFSREDSEDDTNDDDVRVLKSIIKSHIGNEDVLEEMRREILVMSNLKHPNIAQLYEAFERFRHVYLIMEYCPGGNLTNRVFNEGQSAIIVRKVLSALKYMHSNGVAHRDIKLENILLDGNNEPKIIDFGLAAKFQSDEYANLAGTVGTLYSMAPEVLDGSSYDFKCDIWSVGVVTYLLLSQMQPFWGPYEPMSWHRRRQVMIDLILECRYSPMEGQTWDGVSESAKRFIESLLRFDASDRPTASMAYKSPWISWSEELPALSLMNDGVQDLSYKKSQEQLTEFRRKACILLTTECNLTQISELQQRLEQRDTTGRGFVTAKDLADEILALGKSDAKMLSDDQLPKDGGASIEYIDFIAQVQRGHRRNTMNKLGSVVDELGAKSTKQVKIAALLHRLNPNDFPDDFWQDLRTMLGALRDFHGEQGSLSSYDVLNWMEKRMSHDNGNRFANDVVG